MMMLFKIGSIEINFQTFVAFFLGLGLGFLLLLLIYLYAVLRSLNKELRLRKTQEDDIDEEEIKWLIEDAQAQFQNKELRDEVGFAPLLYRQLKELSIDISRKFYPDSNYPYFELTIDETIALVHYITDRIDELLSSPILKLFRGMTIRRLVELNDTKEKLEESRVVSTAKKYKVGEVFSSTLKVLNAINPFYWFRKLTVDKAIKVIIEKISLSIIAITGEETYKIYSKKVFNEEKTLKTNVEDIYSEVEEELKDVDIKEEELK